MTHDFHRILHHGSFILTLAFAMAGCGGGGDTSSTASALSTAQPTRAARVAVGDKLFNDAALSAGGSQACATCHVADRGHADAAGVFLPLGGTHLDLQGLRSSPSLNYLDGNGAFSIDAQGRAVGGFTWDGRADTRAAQTLGPLLAANEMAHADTSSVVRSVRALAYFGELQSAFSLATDATDVQVLQAVQQALSDYQSGDTDFHPYTSKFDHVQQGSASFTVQEARGLALFNDPRRGACAGCHSSNAGAGQPAAAFTNFGYFALGVPRNISTATADPTFFDMGLCGPLRTDLANRTELCGMFKVPTLRNVALTAPYFHNGAVATLEEAVTFYATRDIDPARWYPSVEGVVQRFNDLPVAYRGNVTQRPPFGLQPGAAPQLSPQDVADIVAFLRTLSDGHAP
jgi:cytochrome c peroxidase